MLKNLRQLEPGVVPLGAKLRPLALFDGASIELTPGVWMIALSGSAKWKYAPNVEVRCVLDGDARSGAGPKAFAANEGSGSANGAASIRGFTAIGPVEIPDGPHVKLELMAALRGVRSGFIDDEVVEFSGLNFFAMKIG